MEADNYLFIWTVYDNPKDYPGLFVARKSEARKGVVLHTHEVLTATTLQALREQIPAGLLRQPRHPLDEPHIVECWF
jgi:hypothetical protein